MMLVTNWDDVPVLLDVALVARILGMNVITVQKWCQSGEMPATKIGREWRVRKERLQAWIDGERGGAQK